MGRTRVVRAGSLPRLLAALVAVCGAVPPAIAEEPFQVEVNILSAKIMKDGTPIGTAKRGAKLTARGDNADSYLVDLPGAHPPQAGWISKQEVHRVEDVYAKLKQRLASIPTEQRQQAIAYFNIRLKRLNDLEKTYDELCAKHQWRESLPVAKQVAELTEELFGPKATRTADKLTTLGSRLNDLGDYPAARSYHEQALVIRREILGEKHSDTAASLNNLGSAALAMGNYPAARRYFELALAIGREVLGEKHSDTAASLNNLGVVADDMGDYPVARRYHEQALEIKREVLGAKHPDTADSLNNLGIVAAHMNDYPVARRHFEQVLAIRREVLGKKHVHTAASLNNLGNVANDMGDYPAARSYHEQALAIRREVLGEKHPQTAVSLNNLGSVAHDMGDLPAARRYCEQALAIRREVLGAKHPDTASSLDNLGIVLMDLGDYPAARRYHEQALAIRRALLGEKHPNTAASFNNLGNVAWATGDFPAARENHEQALAIKREVLGEKHADTAASFNNLGNMAWAIGDFPAARRYHEQALAIKREVLGDKHPDTARSEVNLAVAKAASDDWRGAADLFEQARKTARRHVAHTLPSLSEKEQLAFLRNTDNWMFHRSLSLGPARRDDSSLVAVSAGWLLNGKAVAEESLSERNRLAREATDPAVRQTLEQWTSVRGQLSVLSQKVPPPAQQAAWRRQVAELESQEQQLARQLAAMGAQVNLGDPWISLADVRDKLPADALLASIVKFQPYIFTAQGEEPHWEPARYVAWLIPPAGERTIEIVDLGEARTIDTAVGRARKALEQAAKTIDDQGEAQAEKQVREALRGLAWLAFEPLEKRFGPARQLILSPDAALWLVPWGALPLANGKYALEKYQIRYVISGRDLVSQAASKPLQPTDPILFANPDFDLGPGDADAATRAILRSTTSPEQVASSRGLGSLGSLPRVGRLLGTAEEAAAIKPSVARYAGVEPTLYEDRYALEGVFKALHRPRVLVLSTHGFFMPDQEVQRKDERMLGLSEDGSRSHVALTTEGKPLENPLLRCGLLLAGCNQRPDSDTAAGVDDGILTGMEIVGTDLRGTELVVLSACETGLGQVRNGEGVAGLRQAFQLAGAKAVVSTLWQIPDQETVQLMTDFFANLSAGQTKADALRNAQLALIQARRANNSAAHPYYWAAFTLTGD